MRTLYAQQVAERGFSSDPVQLAVVDRLEDLRQRLAASHTGSLARRLLGTLGHRAPRRPVRGLYLWGGVGRGKTWLMDMFYQSLPFQQRRRRHFHRFMHDVHAELKTLQHREDPLEIVAERIAQEARVLCFDELFVSDIADAMILGGLFAGLFKRGVTLVATSNVPPQDLYKNGLQRQRFLPTIELILQQVEVLPVEGKIDYRLRQLTQAGTYLPAGVASTREKLEALFTELADQAGPTELQTPQHPRAPQSPAGRQPPMARPPDTPPLADQLPAAQQPYMPPLADQTPPAHQPHTPPPAHQPHTPSLAHQPPASHQPRTPPGAGHSTATPLAFGSAGTLEIEGRPIPVVRESSGVVWFDFMALCSGPRSQEDYIEIARDYQSVIVSDIPVFDSLHENEARRFIALVDELYDRNVNLIVSAAAPPTELYRGDRLTFQFERTSSRLIEMQSGEYLAREHRP